MKTYTTHTIVKNHKITIELPMEFAEQSVEVNVIIKPKEVFSLKEKLALVKDLSGSYKGKMIVTDEDMRRENIYDETKS